MSETIVQKNKRMKKADIPTMMEESMIGRENKLKNVKLKEKKTSEVAAKFQ